MMPRKESFGRESNSNENLAEERNMQIRTSRRRRCKLNDQQCLTLEDILIFYNKPIVEEAAWALCYQTIKKMSELSHNQFFPIKRFNQILLHKNGDVVFNHSSENPLADDAELKVALSLGLLIYKALDYGMDKEEEPLLSTELQSLITYMTDNFGEGFENESEDRVHETDDEGIERDSGDGDCDEFFAQSNNSVAPYGAPSNTDTFKTILEICIKHTQRTDYLAEAYYRTLLRDLVAESLELSDRLDKTAGEEPTIGGNMELTDRTDVRIWRAIQARFWIQLIGELKTGVKLKKVQDDIVSRGTAETSRKEIEYELTPFEILMSDIREQRYRLRKTPPPASSNLRKDARAIILDFIRSRPTLKKASDRQLPPLEKQLTLREQLMESIKKPPTPLRSFSARRCIPIPESLHVLGEVPPEQEQESAQDVAAQWFTSDEQKTGSTVIDTNRESATTTNAGFPIPQPRSRIGKVENRVLPGVRNRKSHRRNISRVADGLSEEAYVKNVKKESPVVPRPLRRDFENAATTAQPRKLIPVDFDLKLDAEDDDDDDDPDFNQDYAVTRFDDEDDAVNYWQMKENYPCGVERIHRKHKHYDPKDDDEADSANPWHKTGGLKLTKHEYHRFCDTQLESYDLATQCPSRRASVKKHSIKRPSILTTITGTASLPHSRPQSRQQTNAARSSLSPSPNISLSPSPNSSPQPKARQPRRAYTIADQSGHNEALDWQENEKQQTSLGEIFSEERLSLTLEEIVHIRSVLTKAELESLPVEGRVKEDVEKRRVCFLCLKTRFGLLGPWGQRCRLCERTVCVKCYSKMRIPTEHFAHVPVILLSPGLLLSPSSSEPDGKNSWLSIGGAVDSAPASPAPRRKNSGLRGDTPEFTPTNSSTPMSSPAHASIRRDDSHGPERRPGKITGSPAALSTTRAFSTNSSPDQRLVAERLRGVSMVVCHDCRIMVIQIIKSSRTTRATIRNNAISRLTLNLSPAYV